jgi:predicted RNA polymerase sigma factor
MVMSAGRMHADEVDTDAALVRHLDRLEDACAAYERALELVHSDAERASSSGG